MRADNFLVNMKNIYLIMILAFAYCLNLAAFADEQSSTDNLKTRTLSLILKNCIKAYLVNADFQVLKKEKIASIKSRNESQFAADYSQSWGFLKKCPDLVAKYRLRPGMTQQQTLKIINRLTLKDCLEAVDDIPDEVLVGQFNNLTDDPEDPDRTFNERINLFIKKGMFAEGGR